LNNPPQTPKPIIQQKPPQPQKQQLQQTPPGQDDDEDVYDEEFEKWFDKVGHKLEGSEYGLLLDWREDKERLKAITKDWYSASCSDKGFSTSEDSSNARKQKKKSLPIKPAFSANSSESEDSSGKSGGKTEHQGSKRKELKSPFPDKKRKKRKKEKS